MESICTTTHREPDFAARTVNFLCCIGGTEIPCRISFDAFAVYYGIERLNRGSVLAAFDDNRDQIEQAAQSRHRRGLHEPDGSLFVEADDLALVGARSSDPVGTATG